MVAISQPRPTCTNWDVSCLSCILRPSLQPAGLKRSHLLELGVGSTQLSLITYALGIMSPKNSCSNAIADSSVHP